jgi:cation transport ATPase
MLPQIGNRTLMNENGVSIPPEAESFLVDLELNAKTGILVAFDSSFMGLMGIADPLKREAAVVVEGLKKMGIHPVMLTGDNWRTAQAVAKEVCLSCLYSNHPLSDSSHRCLTVLIGLLPFCRLALRM